MNKSIIFIFSSKFIDIRSMVNAGLSFPDINVSPLILEIECTNNELGSAIKDRLSKSIEIAVDDRVRIIRERDLNVYEEYENQHSKNLIKQFGYRGKKKFEQDLESLGLGIANQQYYFRPCRTFKDSYTGIENIEDITLPLSATDEEVGIAARKAMALCTSVYK